MIANDVVDELTALVQRRERDLRLQADVYELRIAGLQDRVTQLASALARRPALDWKRFQDELPTESRSVILALDCSEESTWSLGWKHDWVTEVLCVALKDDGTWAWSCSYIDIRSENPNAWQEYMTDALWSHWAYVDPPVTTETKP
jgi:hypothetical protein